MFGENPQVIAFIVGAILVASGVLGGGIELRELKIPRLERTTRGLAILVGAAFIAIGLGVGKRGPSDNRADPYAPPTLHEQKPVSQTFANPMFQSYRLDWCYRWADDCGSHAASAWCQREGYERADSFEQDPHVEARGIVTKVLSTGELCQGPQCDSFRVITCSR